MEFFGLTLYGVPDPIKDMMHPNYKEPETQLDLTEIVEKGSKKSFSELVKELDCYIGRIDGHAYGSYDRLLKMRTKGEFKPVGPNEMYRYAGTDGMKFGFWMSDPALKDAKWMKSSVFRPKPSTDIGGFLQAARKVDKYFKF